MEPNRKLEKEFVSSVFTLVYESILINIQN